MDGQSLALEPIARNLQRLSPVRMFHLAVEISPGVPGRVFGFVEAADSREAEALLASIEKTVGRCAPTDGASFDDRAAELVTALNRAAAEARRSGKAAAGNNEIAALAAVTSGVQVALSGRNATALRIHRDGKNLDSAELLPSVDSAGEALFRSLVIGGLGGRDALFLSGRRIFDYIARDHLSRIVANAEPETARETILSALADLGQSVSLAAFLVKPATVRSRASIPDTTSPSIDSLDEFLNQATHTERMLNPSLQFPAIGAVRRLLGGRKDGQAAPTRQGGAAAARWQQKVLERSGDFFKLLAAAARSAAQSAASGSRRLARMITNKNGGRGQELSAIREGVAGQVKAGRTRLFKLPFAARVALLSAVAVGLVFAGSVFVVGSSRSKKENLAAYQAALSAVGDKRDAIEASAIYSDSSRAWTLLDEARALVAALPTDTQERRAEVDRLAGLLEEDARQLRRETSTDDPTLVADLSAVKPGARGQALIASQDTLYVADSAGGAIFILPASGGSPGRVLDLPAEGRPVSSAPDSRNLFLTDGPGLVSVEKNKVSAVPADFGGGRPAGIAVWNDRLYSLDPANSTISRHNRSGDGYGPGTPWVKSGSEELRDGRSVAIDGSVYVGTSSGKILKYHLGTKTDFTPGRLEPALKSIVRLLAPPDGAFLYLLAPETKRVVVLVKETGALAAQYTSPKFDALSDMAVDEPAKTLYLLNGSAVYSLPLTHLQ